MADDLDRFRTAKVSVDGRDVPVTAPYNFVPLEPFCIPTPWGDKPCLDKPHADGLCGELTVTWTAEAPILVGGAGEASAQFFRTDTGDDSIALPGSTLRGAVRALLEGVTMARMEHIDRGATYSVRDLGGGDNNRWQEAMTGLALSNARSLSQRIGGGFLTSRRISPREEIWHLHRCNWVELHTSAILDFFNAGRSTERQIKVADFDDLPVSGKYALLGAAALGELAICTDGDRFRVGDVGLAATPSGRWRRGRLVFSSIDPKRAKRREAFFYTDDLDEPEKVDETDIARFLFIHGQIARGDTSQQARGTLDFWQEAKSKNPSLAIPVFWLRGTDGARSRSDRSVPAGLVLSLARSMKMPHAYSVGEVLDRQRPQAMTDTFLDFVQALFGHVPHEADESAPPANEPRKSAWRSRVQFSDAPAEPNSEWNERPVSGVMGAPRPSFSPYYLVHSDEADHPGPVDWSDPKANLAGFKRYPVRDRQAAFIGTAENQRIATTMAFAHPKGRGLAFTGRVRFHNLLPAELGALIFALQFGAQGDASLRHAIGRGKPQGYGRMRAEISKARIERNDGNPTSFDGNAAAWVQMFQTHVEENYHRLRRPQPEKPKAFHTIPFVAAALAMQDRAIGAMLEDRLVYPGVRGAQLSAEGEATLKAYVAIKKKAREKVPEARLPRFPHRQK